MNILGSLENLGLSQKEAAAYAALITMKKGTALTVAAAAHLKRPTAYLVLESLREKKLVAMTMYREVRDYRALPLEHLKNFIQKQSRAVATTLPTIERLYNARPQKIRLRVYQEIASVKTLLEKALIEKAQLNIIGDQKEFTEYLGDYWQFYYKRSQQLGNRPVFKASAGPVSLLLWSDKVAFVKFGGQTQVCAFKNPAWHKLYQDLWKNY